MLVQLADWLSGLCVFQTKPNRADAKKVVTLKWMGLLGTSYKKRNNDNDSE